VSAKLVVWDVDGTLVDSRAVIFECCKSALTGAGLAEPSYDAVRQVVGLSLTPALAALAPGLGAAEQDRMVETYKETFHSLHRQPGFIEPLYAGAAETLVRLKAEGWLMAIATGKSRRGIEVISRMHGWAGVFDSTHSADDGPGKPDPAMLLEAMRALGCTPAQTIMVGDTAHDMRMARAAGVRAQGVSWGFHTAEEVRAAGADDVADDFVNLNSKLDEFSKGTA
jgi:phosphoglycolate phosphatase